MERHKVLIIDDSKLIRDLLTSILNADARLQVVGCAAHPYQARQMIKDLEPDVLTLDIEMPHMNGIDFLKNLMRLRPMPVVMISTLTAKGSAITLQAMEIGAIDFLEKPADLNTIMDSYRYTVIHKVLAAANAPRQRLQQYRQKQHLIQQPPEKTAASSNVPRNPERIVAVGASTGGLEALKELLEASTFCGNESIVVALHLPAAFTKSFAKRLDDTLPYNVFEAENGQRIIPGSIYIAPGGQHLTIQKRAVGYHCVLLDTPPVLHHKPSVDVLFESVAKEAQKNAYGIVLTGMGKDGAQGLLKIQQAGGSTGVQDEISSVVWGMPGAAYQLGAAQKVASLAELGASINAFFNSKVLLNSP